MISLGLTGGYATGKSTVAGILRSLGARVVEADKLAHAAMERDQPAWREVVAVFGPGVLRPDGEIDRAALGRIVFARPELRRRLEEIVHPRVIAAIRAAREEARLAGERVFVAEVPLLYEAGLEGEFDRIWVISADPGRQRMMALARDGLSESDLAARLAAQMPLAEKERRAHLVIRNDGDLEELRRRVVEAWEALLREHAP
ncbi:MAG: dephospho-CoA kinase [Firmicutes bacterium]|nr:dephospho-CoA kinase [Bacillota bacterium]